MFSSAAALFLLALASSTQATVFLTAPVASTSFTGGQDATLTWQDDGAAPSLKDFGPAKIFLSTGNAIQQTNLQTISQSTDVGTVNSLTFKVDPTIGPNSNQYFIRIESIATKDLLAPQFPALAFSAKFTLSSMTGTFSSTVQAQIDGQSTAPLAGATTAGSSTSAPATAGRTTTSGSATPTTSSRATSTSARSTAASASPTNAAISTSSRNSLLVGALASVFGILLL
jgi:hypothetical protein